VGGIGWSDDATTRKSDWRESEDFGKRKSGWRERTRDDHADGAASGERILTPPPAGRSRSRSKDSVPGIRHQREAAVRQHRRSGRLKSYQKTYLRSRAAGVRARRGRRVDAGKAYRHLGRYRRAGRIGGREDCRRLFVGPVPSRSHRPAGIGMSGDVAFRRNRRALIAGQVGGVYAALVYNEHRMAPRIETRRAESFVGVRGEGVTKPSRTRPGRIRSSSHIRVGTSRSMNPVEHGGATADDIVSIIKARSRGSVST